MARSRVNREWSVDSVNWAFGSGLVESDNVALALDQTSTGVEVMSSRIRVTRMLCAVNLSLVNQNEEANTVPTGAFFALGALLKNQGDTTAYSPATVDDADSPWVFWKSWGLPVGNLDPFSTLPLTSFSYPDFWLDWQFRGGRGTNMQHDNGLFLVGGIRPSLASWSAQLVVNVALHYRLLREAV